MSGQAKSTNRSERMGTVQKICLDIALFGPPLSIYVISGLHPRASGLNLPLTGFGFTAPPSLLTAYQDFLTLILKVELAAGLSQISPRRVRASASIVRRLRSLKAIKPASIPADTEPSSSSSGA